MPLELSYDSLDNVDDAFHSLYTETDGVWNLTGISGMKTQKDVDTLQGSLAKERADHKAAKASIALWGDLKPEETMVRLDRITELELAAEGKLDEEAIEKLVVARLGQATGPLQRQLDQATADGLTLTEENNSLRTERTNRTLDDNISTAANKLKVRPEAMADVRTIVSGMMELVDGKAVTRDGLEVTAGVSAEQALTELQSSRFYWWPDSTGGGSRGGGVSGHTGKNPFTAEHWNMTAQGVLYQQDKDLATKLAKAAGTTVGGTRPTPSK